jgi:hypothetical protein
MSQSVSEGKMGIEIVMMGFVYFYFSIDMDAPEVSWQPDYRSDQYAHSELS